MRIDPNILARLRAARAGATPSPDTVGPPAPRPADPVGDSCAHIPSQELQQLLTLLREQPEARAEVVARVARRLAEGYYLTPEAAERAAVALLDSGEV